MISPSPYIQAAWKTNDPVARQPFEARSTILTRLEELELVRWIEHNHIIGPRPARPSGEVPVGMFVNVRRFAEAVEPITNLLASVRGPLRFRRTRLVAGVPERAPKHERRAAPKPSKQRNPSGRMAPAQVGAHHG